MTLILKPKVSWPKENFLSIDATLRRCGRCGIDIPEGWINFNLDLYRRYGGN